MSDKSNPKQMKKLSSTTISTITTSISTLTTILSTHRAQGSDKNLHRSGHGDSPIWYMRTRVDCTQMNLL